MSIQSIGPPPLTKNQDSLLDRWLQLFWKNQASIVPTSSDSTIANLIFGLHPVAPIQPNALGADAQLQLSLATFRPHVQAPTPVNLLAVDSNMILAGQIFGS